MANIDELFKIMVTQGASDLHLTAEHPTFACTGLIPLEYRNLSNQDIQTLVFEILNEKQKIFYRKMGA